MTPSTNSILDNIRLIYGNTIARELLEFKLDEDRLALRVQGFGSNANFNMKKSVFLLFINRRSHRLLGLSIYSTIITLLIHVDYRFPRSCR